MVRLHLTRDRVRARFADERGIGMVTALMLTLAVFGVGAVWAGVGTHQVEASSYERSREQALHAAEAGINFAVSRLAGDILWSGTASPVQLGDDTGEYEVTVTPVDATDPYDLDRYIVAKGYAPSKGATRVASRQLEQQVLLEPTPDFAYALFASPGGIVSQNNADVTGDIYSATDLIFGQRANLDGTIVTRGNVVIGNQSTVQAYLHALGNATIDDSQTKFHGTVYAGGDVSLTGQLYGDVQAGGSVTLSGSQASVSGTIKENSPPPEPPLLSQPTYTWDQDNYASPFVWSSASGFVSWWDSNKTNFYGAHKAGGNDDNSNKITLDKKWTMSGDVTIYASGPVHIAADVERGDKSVPMTLSIISDSVREPAISMTNNFTVNDPDLKVLLFAPNGTVDFSQLKDFHGAVYGKNIKMGQNFTLDRAVFDLPGFDFDGTSAPAFLVKLRTFREVPYQP